MKIIINEMKKIFNLKSVGLLVLGSFIIYKMFIAFYFDTFPNGRPELDTYNITTQMIKDYGSKMDEAELEDLKEIYNNKLKEADEFLSDNKDFNQFGIYSYEDYLNGRDKSFDERNSNFEEVKWDYLGKEEGNIFWELQEFPRIIGWYESNYDYYYSSRELYGEEYEERINEIISNNENESIFPDVVFNNYNTMISYVGVCIVIEIAFMLTPLFLKDKKEKVDYLQYSSKEGRNIFKRKLTAGLLSALLITTVELIIFLTLYKGNKTSIFFKSNISSVLNSTFWFNITFIQYIMITIISIYIISIITAFISMFISNKASSYIVGIGIQVPTIATIIALISGVLLNDLFVLYIPKYLALIIYLGLISITAIIIIKAIKKDKMIDIID